MAARITFFSCLVMASLALSGAQSCATFTFSQSRSYERCNSLRRLGASLHWTYHPSNAAVDVAFRAPQTSNGWVAWGINPRSTGMVGTQALVAFVNSSAGGVVMSYTSPVSGTAPLQPADISVPITNLQGEFSGGALTIYATLLLANNKTQVNHVWQSSTIFSAAGFPAGHPTFGDNVLSAGTLDFMISGESTSSRSPAPSPFGGSPAPSPSGGSPPPSCATLLLAGLSVCGCACMLGWMQYVGM